MDVILFDVNQYKRGIIDPFEFEKNFSSVHIPEIIYKGDYNKQFVEQVRNGEYDVDEGVVVKGLTERGKIWMCKVKTRQWLKNVTLKMEGKLHLFADDLNAYEDELA